MGFLNTIPPKKTRLSGLVLSSYIFSHQPGSRKFLSFQKWNCSNIRIRTPQKNAEFLRGYDLEKAALQEKMTRIKFQKGENGYLGLGHPLPNTSAKRVMFPPPIPRRPLVWLAPVFIPHAWSSCCSRCLALSPPLLDPCEATKGKLETWSAIV